MDDRDPLYAAQGQLRQLLETAGGILSLVDFTDAVTFTKEDGAPTRTFRFSYGEALAQALTRPSYTACAYLNEMQLREIRAASRAFAIANPYWVSIRENKIAYGIGTGHVPAVVPRHKAVKVTDELLQDVSDEIEQFQRLNKYRQRQGEKITRLDRDGEYFLRFDESANDGILRVRFIEPLLVADPPGLSAAQDVWFGIQFEGDYETPVGYYVRRATYDGGLTDYLKQQWQTMIPARDIQHRKANVDIGSPRGLPTTFVVQDTLTQAVSTRKSMGRLVDVRARIALIVKQINATLGQIQPLLLRNRAGQAANSAGQLRNAFQLPYGTVINTNDQREYAFPAQNVETDKIVHSLKSDLQEAAAAVGLADFTISGDSKSAFSNAMIKEGPMDRAIGKMQADLIEDDIEVYERALLLAVIHGRLPGDILKRVRFDITPPGVIARDRLANTQADDILVRNGAMSVQTMAARSNLDPEDEQEKIRKITPPAIDKQKGGDPQPQQSLAKQTARGVPPGKEPGPGVNNTQGTEKEAVAEESVHITKPTKEDIAMAATVVGDEWQEQTKRAIMALPNTQTSPMDQGVRVAYEPGVEGVPLGEVDGKMVWAIDPSALAVRHDTETFVVAGNSAYWPFLQPNTVVVDWSRKTSDLWATIFHEITEARLMEVGKWAYARAHRMSVHLERAWLLALRPELEILRKSA